MTEHSTYDLQLEGTGAKTALIDSADIGLPAIEVTSPPEFGGSPGVWTPEHFFVAALSSCLMTTFWAIAANSNLEVVGYADSPSGRLIQDEDRLFRIDLVTLRPRIVIVDDSKTDKARRVIEKAERACLISRSVSCDVVLEPTVEVARVATG